MSEREGEGERESENAWVSEVAKRERALAKRGREREVEGERE